MTDTDDDEFLITARIGVRRLRPEGEKRLFRAHQEGRIHLLGRPIEPGSNKQGKRQLIPPEYFADPVRLDRTTNEIRPDGNVANFAQFEQQLSLNRWADVKVSAAEVESLVRSLAVRPPGSAGAETECGKWLVQEMKEHSERPYSKLAYWKQANPKFDGLTRKGFDRAWESAKAKTGSQWGKAGRPRDRN